MTRMLSTIRARGWFNFPERRLTVQPRPARARADAESTRPAQPERRLLVELLHSAVLDLTNAKPRGDADPAELRELARRWIAGEPAPIAFATVCELLEIDTDAARAALLDEQHSDRAALLEIAARAA